jgi:hypothetical protein
MGGEWEKFQKPKKRKKRKKKPGGGQGENKVPKNIEECVMCT